MEPYNNFSEDVVTMLSGVDDGSMKAAGNNDGVISENAVMFLQRLKIDSAVSIRVRLDYERDNFCDYVEVSSQDAGDGMTRPSRITSDALFTRQKCLALFLPLADCAGAVLYDPVQKVLGLSHLGRHNLGQHGAAASVRYMVRQFRSDPADIHVLLTAAAGQESYPLFAFNGRGIHEVAVQQFIEAGVARGNIVRDQRDTTTDMTLFSHSEYLKHNRKTDGRHAVVAMRR